MHELRLSWESAPDEQAGQEILQLVARATEAAGHEALSEHKRIEVASGVHGAGASSDGGFVVGVLARDPLDLRLVGYGHLNRHSETYAMEITVDPAEANGEEITDAIFSALVDRVAELGGGQTRLWVTKATESDDVRVFAQGFHRERNLIQMRCELPLPRQLGLKPSAEIVTRPFVVGVDEDAWLIANNRAFADHPEQGNWERQSVVDLESEPWFNPDGFLVLEADGRMAGSCWTKVHSTTDPPMGEIYVIGVDPDYHGRGWGRALTAAGLDWLAAQGLTMGMLYVDEDNQAATTMYRSMGFVTDHVDRAYLGIVKPG